MVQDRLVPGEALEPHDLLGQERSVVPELDVALARDVAETLVGRHVGRIPAPLHSSGGQAVNRLNLAIRFFVVDARALAAAAYWGWEATSGPGRWYIAVWRRPRSASSGRSSSRPERGSRCSKQAALAIELVLLGLVTVGLAATGPVWLGVAYGAIALGERPGRTTRSSRSDAVSRTPIPSIVSSTTSPGWSQPPVGVLEDAAGADGARAEHVAGPERCVAAGVGEQAAPGPVHRRRRCRARARGR